MRARFDAGVVALPLLRLRGVEVLDAAFFGVPSFPFVLAVLLILTIRSLIARGVGLSWPALAAAIYLS